MNQKLWTFAIKIQLINYWSDNSKKSKNYW